MDLLHVFGNIIFSECLFKDPKHQLLALFPNNRILCTYFQRRNTIRQDLKSQPFRRLFVDELCKRIIPPVASSKSSNSTFPEAVIVEFERRASLNWEQFDVIVGLLDEALRYEGMSYNTVIAPPVLELATRISTVGTGFAFQNTHVQFNFKLIGFKPTPTDKVAK